MLLVFGIAGVMMDLNSGTDSKYYPERVAMVRRQIEARGVKDARVLEAMRKVPRHLFVPPDQIHNAYEDGPFGIGYGQTISQPYIVAYMTELLRLKPHHKVLEIGSGCGYQTAVLAELAGEVYGIEIIPELAERGAELLNRLGYRNLNIKTCDGYYGWPQKAPFESILVAAAPSTTPEPLLEQLADGGRMVIPVGESSQYLEVYWRDGNRIRKEQDIPVRFVPMTGRSEKPKGS
jgi:protein-L-isoaspartate(D-aspartate) O-methyltransferase